MEQLSAPILGWGNNDLNQLDPIYLTYTNIKAISCGYFNSFGITKNGIIIGWGDYESNQLDQIYTNIITIKCGRYYSIGLREDGTIVCSR